MLWLIGFLTALLVLDSLFLILLVLVQLPKKEAGLGQAFGSSATDALFGAGSGNALTKMTKYTAGIFFALTLIIYLMYNHQVGSKAGAFATRVQQAGKDVDTPPPPKPVIPPISTNALTNVTGTPSTNTNIPKVTIPTSANTNVKGLLTAPVAEEPAKPAPPK